MNNYRLTTSCREQFARDKMVEILKQHNKAAAKKLDALTAEQLDAMDDAALAALLDMSDLAKKYGVAGDVNGDGDHDDDSGMDVSTLLVVDNVPVVDESKEEKLVSVLRKLFAKSGGKVKEGGAGLFMPMAEEKGGKKMSRGYVDSKLCCVACLL